MTRQPTPDEAERDESTTAATRRRVLAGLTGAGATALAGCSALGFTEEPAWTPPDPVEDPPQAVYYPSHAEGMQMVGTARAGDYAVGVTYSFPHRFWTVTRTSAERVSVRPEDDVHLMATVWDPETGTVLPVGSGVQFTVAQGGETVVDRAPWPMLSQVMGFHYGGNVSLAGDGSYEVRVDVSPAGAARVGDFAGRLDEGGTATLAFDYSQAERDVIDVLRYPEKKGQRGAVSLAQMEMIPVSQAPTPDALPGRVLGTGESGDATVVLTVGDPPAGVESGDGSQSGSGSEGGGASEDGGAGDGQYLAVSPRTPYNRVPLPMMAVSATVERGGTAAWSGTLSKAVGPDRGYHYGATVPGVASGDRVTVAVDAPPQASRHEGYETAFLEMDPVTVTVA